MSKGMRNRRRCPHSRLRAIYGDEIRWTLRGARLTCLDCGALLDGPPRIAELRANEAAELSRRVWNGHGWVDKRERP